MIDRLFAHTMEEIKYALDYMTLYHPGWQQRIKSKCNYLGPGDRCTYFRDHDGKHSWE